MEVTGSWEEHFSVNVIKFKPAFKNIMIPFTKLVVFGLLIASSFAADTEDAPATDKPKDEARVLVGKHVSSPYIFTEKS